MLTMIIISSVVNWYAVSPYSSSPGAQQTLLLFSHKRGGLYARTGGDRFETINDRSSIYIYIIYFAWQVFKIFRMGHISALVSIVAHLPLFV